MKKSLLILCVGMLATVPAWALDDNGLVTLKSQHSVNQTIDELEKILMEKGMTLFARIDHAAGAAEAGKTLRPTELLIFGNPKVGSPLMQCQQSIAIDLPQKALAWQDAEGQVWLSYNDPMYLAKRHRVTGCDEVLGKISKALGNFAGIATQ